MNKKLKYKLYSVLKFEDFIAGLKKLGVKRGDTVFIHSSLSRFGYIEGGPLTVINAIRQVIGKDGTIIMPSFNFDIFSHSQVIFDIMQTSSKMGVITEIFRQMEDVKRNTNMFHPLCFQGPLNDEILECQTLDTWGENSPYELFYKKNIKILLLGTNFFTTSIFHYCEQRNSVPYREPVIYDGIVIDESGNKKHAKCRRLKRKFGADSDFNILYSLYNKEKQLLGKDNAGMIKLNEVNIGTAVCRCFNMREMVDLCDNILQQDSTFLKLKKNLTPMPTMVDEKNYDMLDLITELYKKNRVLISDDYHEALRYIRNFIPLRYHIYPSGMKVWTWKIPKKWEIIEAYIINSETGEKLIDSKQNLLHIHINSCPIDREISHDELMQHLTFRDDFPEAVPYSTKYYREDWGFSVRARDLKKFNSKRYKITINSQLINGYMTIGEFTVKGYTDETIIFPIHLDHPWQCNDNLSGCAVAIELIFKLLKTTDLKYSYKFLFLPETIGTIAFLAENEELIPKLKFGIVFDSVGNNNQLNLTKTKDTVSMINKYAITAMKEIAKSEKILNFFDDDYLKSANDERILQAPFVNIPSIYFSRSPFKEYHTDKDTPKIIHKKMLDQMVDVLYTILMFIERDFKPKQNYKGILSLSAYDMYDYSWTLQDNLAIEKILHLLTGELSIFEIAEKIERDFHFVYDFIIKLHQKGLITMN